MWSVISSNVLAIAAPIDAVRALEEGEDRCGVVVEHLRARELAVADLVEREDRRVQALAGGAAGALVVEHRDLVVVCGDYAGVHSAFGGRGLQRPPRAEPRVGRRLDVGPELVLAAALAAVGQRGSVEE